MDHLKRNRFRYLVGIFGSSLGVYVFYQLHLQNTPITQRERFVLFTTDQLAEIEKYEKEMVFFLFWYQN